MKDLYDLLIVGHDNMGTLVPLGDPDAKEWMTHLATKWVSAKYFQIQPKKGVHMPIVRIDLPEGLTYPVYYIRTQKKINKATRETLDTRRFYTVGWIDGDMAVLTSVGPFGNVATFQVAVSDLPEYYRLKMQEA